MLAMMITIVAVMALSLCVVVTCESLRFIATERCSPNVSTQLLSQRSDGAMVDASGLCVIAISRGGFDDIVAARCGSSPPIWKWHSEGAIEYVSSPGRCLSINGDSSLTLSPCNPQQPTLFRADRGRIIAMRDGLCLSIHRAVPAPSAASKSYFDVVADCGADPTGATDSTDALRKCFVAAYRFGGSVEEPLWPAPVFFPLGTYTVSDTIELRQINTPTNDDGVNVCPARFLSFSAFGSSALPSQRPKLYLAPSSPGFASSSGYKAVVHIHNANGEGLDMNNVWRGIDVDLTAPGNPGAVGIDHAGAQGGTVSDVTVRALSSTFSCFAGIDGAGGEHSNIACYGARYGIWAYDSQPVPVIVGATLINQSVSAIAYNSQESLSLIGTVIVTAPNATGPAISTAGGNRGMSIVDTTIDCCGDEQVAIHTSASLYVRDMFVRGCRIAISQSSAPPLPVPAEGWLHIKEWARGTDTGRYFFSNVLYIDGVRTVNDSVRSVVVMSADMSPPSDLQSRHIWDDAKQAGVDSPDVANAKSTCGASGDDVTDDTVALQTCLNKYTDVFLPPGRYRISATLDVSAGGSFVGMGASFSFLLAASSGFPHSTSEAPNPMVRTANHDADARPTTIAFLGIYTWHHLAHVFTMDWRTENPLSLWRTNFETRECECLWTSGYQRRAPPDIPCSPPVNLTIPKSVFRGLGRVHSFVNDDTGHILSTGSTYRAVLIANTSAFAGPQSRTRFYSLNLEHGQSESNGEIANASYVDIYSVKIEGNMPVLWFRGNTENVALLALGGGFTAWPMNWTFPSDFTPATPSTIRIDAGATNVTLALLQDHGLAQGSSWPPSLYWDCRWSHYYPFPGTAVAKYPFSTFPNATMWNCWEGYFVSSAYWGTVWSPSYGLSHPGDKPIIWRTSDRRGAHAVPL